MDVATLICLPTYNEARNLAAVVERIRAAVPEAGVLVVDDASPDGTGELADRMAEADSRMRVLHRPAKEGLGRAYLDGFRMALETTGAEAVVQMDADLSHPPERLPALLELLAEADLVLGSRYIPGGGTEGWERRRRILSRLGGLYARAWTGLPVRDPTGGFKAWRREMLTRVLARPLRCDGYAFQVETTFVAARLGGRVREVPIRFAGRKRDTSKMSLAVTLKAVWKVPLLRWWHCRAAPPGVRC